MLALLWYWRTPLAWPSQKWWRSFARRENAQRAIGDPAPWMEATGIFQLSLSEALARRPVSVQDRWFAPLYVHQAGADGGACAVLDDYGGDLAHHRLSLRDRADAARWHRAASRAMSGAGGAGRSGGRAVDRLAPRARRALGDALKDVAERMLATCDGQVYETAEGQVGILGGAWSVPDVTITADDILHVEMKDGYDPFPDYNVLKGSFVSPAHSYQPTEVAERRDELALITQPERVQQLDIDMCPSSGQMQRLMKIREAKDRREYVGIIRTDLVGMKARFPKGDGVHTIRIIAD